MGPKNRVWRWEARAESSQVRRAAQFGVFSGCREPRMHVIHKGTLPTAIVSARTIGYPMDQERMTFAPNLSQGVGKRIPRMTALTWSDKSRNFKQVWAKEAFLGRSYWRAEAETRKRRWVTYFFFPFNSPSKIPTAFSALVPPSFFSWSPARLFICSEAMLLMSGLKDGFEAVP